MRARFGDGYDAYLQSRTAPVERAFSLRRALRVNKEYKAVLGLIALVADSGGESRLPSRLTWLNFSSRCVRRSCVYRVGRREICCGMPGA